MVAESLRIRRALLTPEHPLVVQSSEPGVLKAVNGKYDETIPLIREAADLEVRVLGLDHPDPRAALQASADLPDARARTPRAMPLLRESLRIRKLRLRMTTRS
jgi:hypothetical protein